MSDAPKTTRFQNLEPLLEAVESYAEREDDWNVLTKREEIEPVAQILFDQVLNEKIKATNALLAAALAYAKWSKIQ